MQQQLLDLICCPVCQGKLEVEATSENGDEIVEGTLICTHCALTYPIKDSMPHLYHADAAWAPKAQEAEGWVVLHQNMGIYEQGEDAVDLKIPYYPEEPWIQVGKSFDVVLDRLNLSGEETILDLGAGRGWASKQFALRGCRAVALDIVPDPNVGLGRGQALMEHAGTYFERVIGDGERLPFQPESFDLVFSHASLHHSSNLPLLLQNVGQVLRPGGRLYAIEPSISILESEEKVLARDASPELELGINENRPNFLEYRRALARNGMVVSEAFPSHTYQMSDEALKRWAQDVGAVQPEPTLRHPLRFLRRLAIFFGKRLYGILTRRWWPFSRALPQPQGAREGMIQAALLWSGNELILVATKQARPTLSND